MQEESKTDTDNPVKNKKTDGIKTLSKKITDTIEKDDGLLSKILATLTNPMVMIVAIIGILYWYKQQQKENHSNNKQAAKLLKQKKKKKKLKHKNYENNNILTTKRVVAMMD